MDYKFVVEDFWKVTSERVIVPYTKRICYLAVS